MIRTRFVLLGALAACSSATSTRELASSTPVQQTPQAPAWRYLEGGYVHTLNGKPTVLRVGVHEASAPLQGCALYFEGLGDSIANQTWLFEKLASHGYRTVAFDYAGQGGSEGNMNDVRVVGSRHSPDRQIGRMAEGAWKAGRTRFDGQPCGDMPDLLVGWSTGGLEVYRWAVEGRAKKVLLFAPGLRVRFFVGEADQHPTRVVTLEPVMTPASLTRAAENGTFTHVEPARPNHPLKAPFFANDLIVSSFKSASVSVSPAVKGLVFLAGDDTYVPSDKVEKILAKRAPHFEIVNFPGARHEIMNETDDVRETVAKRLEAFLAP